MNIEIKKINEVKLGEGRAYWAKVLCAFCPTDGRYGFVSLPHRFNPTTNFQRLINYTACYMLGGKISTNLIK